MNDNTYFHSNMYHILLHFMFYFGWVRGGRGADGEIQHDKNNGIF